MRTGIEPFFKAITSLILPFLARTEQRRKNFVFVSSVIYFYFKRRYSTGKKGGIGLIESV